MSIDFETREIEQMERDFNKLQLAPIHRQMVSQTAKFLTSYLPISEIALKGFIWKSLQDFQSIKKMTLLDENVINTTPEEKIAGTKAIVDILEGYLVKILRRPEQEELLSKAVKDGFQYYIDNFAYR